MTTIDTTTTTVEPPSDDFVIDDAQLAAVGFLARYGGHTLDAYRHDLSGFFQWAADMQLTVLAATRPHIELFRSWMEEQGLAASTIDRRLSTVCGFYRFAHIDGRIASNPAQYVRRPQVHPSNARGLDRSDLGVFLTPICSMPPSRQCQCRRGQRRPSAAFVVSEAAGERRPG
jgi:integrase/recombinase XerD